MEWYFILAIVGIGFVAGFINTVAGGGSALTLPLLIFLGLPANIANGTNRIAILLQNIVGVKTYHSNKVLNFKTDFRLAVPAVVGALIGALIAVEINESTLELFIGITMIFILLLVIFKPDLWVKGQVGKVKVKPTIIQYFLFFLIGIYGGFIQMGVGFVILAGLVIGCGHNLVRANAIKVFIVLVYTFFAIFIFFLNKQVDLATGLILASGNMLGAWTGARFAIKGGARYVRYVLILALIVVILNIFNVF